PTSYQTFPTRRSSDLKRQNRRGKERRIEQAEGKQHASPFSGQGHQGPGRVRGVGDVALAGSVQRGRRADDDEEDDDHATDASEQDRKSTRLNSSHGSI